MARVQTYGNIEGENAMSGIGDSLEYWKLEIQDVRNRCQRYFATHASLGLISKELLVKAEEEGLYDPRHGIPARNPLPLQPKNV